MAPDRVLIVGLGSIGTRHARLARQLMPNAEIAVLRHRGCDDDPPDGIDRCFSTMDEAVAFAPQAAVVANPATCHVETAARLAEAGVHLLVEKPISHSLDGVESLARQCRAGGTVLAVGYDLRHSRSLRQFRDLVQSGRTGRVLSVRAEVGQFLPSWRPSVDYRQSVSAKASLGGGVLLELSHEVDYLRWIFGEVLWVSAVLTRQSALEIDVEDTAHLTLGLAPSQNEAAIVAQLSLDFIRHDTTRQCVAIGETGTLRWNAITGVVDTFEVGATGWTTLGSHAAAADEDYLAEWRDFLKCIEDGAEPQASGFDGLSTLRVADAARRSSSSGTIVHLPCEGV